MLFPSITFLFYFYFLPLFFALYCAAPGVTFKWSVLDEYAPQLVILAPTERQMFCAADSYSFALQPTTASGTESTEGK